MTSQIRVDEITNRSGLGTVTIYDNGFEFTGVTTFTEDVDITGGLTIGGVLTYEDVTNIDSVGVVTARGGLDVSDTGTPVNIDSTNSGLNKIHFKTGGTTSGYLGNSSTYFFSLSDSSGNQRVRHANNGLYQVLDTSGNVIHQMSSAGSIGIGTAPIGTLTVLTTGNGYVDINGSGGDGAEVRFLKKADRSQTYTIQNNGGANELVQHVLAHSSGRYTWLIGGTERLRITSGGDLLIDTTNTNPTANNVDGTAILSGGGIRLSRDGEPLGLNRGGSDGVFIDMRRDGTSKATMGVTSNALQFSTAGTERLRIRAEGPHLLLGTGGDATYNEITETSSNAGLVIGSSSMTNGGIVIRTGTSGTGRIYFADNSGSDAGRNRGQINYYHNGDYMMFATAGSERLRIDSNGIHKISTAGSTQDGTFFSTQTINNTGSNTYSRVRFDRSGVARFGLTLRNDDKFCISNLYKNASVLADDDAFVMANSSKIGIGMDSPDAKLQIRNTTSYGKDTYATANTGGSQTPPPPTFKWDNVTPVAGHGRGYEAYVQSGDAYPNASNYIDVLIRNASFYRITLKRSHSSADAAVCQMMIYGLANSGNNNYPVVHMNGAMGSGTSTATVQSGNGRGSSNAVASFYWEIHSYNVNTHDTIIRITTTGSNNQGIVALVEEI